MYTFFKVYKKKAIEIGPKVRDKNIRVLLENARIIPKIYLTLTSNSVKIEKLPPTKQYKYNTGSVLGLSETKPTKTSPVKTGYLYVKDENLQNPLEPEEKRYFVVKMLTEAMRHEHEMTHDMSDKELVDFVEEMVVYKPRFIKKQFLYKYYHSYKLCSFNKRFKR
jgi:hypothetical protein